MSTSGKEKERVTTQFCCGFDGRKFPPLIVFKASSKMFPDDGQLPRQGTVARQLMERKSDGISFPDGMALSCNPKAYVYKEELKRTAVEGMIGKPLPMILKLDDYACHKEKDFVRFCEELHIFISPTKRYKRRIDS